ncbi:DUF4097 family beta strand repeat-containing protein [Nocardia sp. NPDC019395]|uniref:DUF4097 family beta strand repeat-containing protein n=1 Tax=Nocardia sp. NPDC019395 TaxID=3154686 RepID=UPI0033C268AA
MPTFETPEPISVTVELGVGNLRITASDRADTVVDVRPSDESDESDVQAAQRIRVDYANGLLQITGPKARIFDFSRKTRSVEVIIDLPQGSQVTGNVEMGHLIGTGRLGECRYKTGAGNIRLDRTGPLRLDTGAGQLTVGDVVGSAEIHTGTGKVSLGEIDGPVVVKSSNGDIVIGAAAGDTRARTANGDISVDRAGAGVEAKTSSGTIRLGEVARGSVELGTAMGELEIGIAEGTAAWLDVNTSFGHVHNLLDSAAQPEKSDETVEVRARTAFGDITIRRS